MALQCYLAMTCGEFQAAATLPEHMAWMACHFSCYGTGLSNLPKVLPEHSMVIVNDRTPIHGHDPSLILEQLLQLQEDCNPSCFLLDFQRPDSSDAAKVARVLTQGLPCPVGISELYADVLDCPVFLPPPALHIPLDAHLSSWKGRRVWLEAATDAQTVTVTAQGSRFEPADVGNLDEPVFEDKALHCRYHTELTENAARFHMLRNKDELTALLAEAEKLGVTQAVGLYQQLG